MTAADESRVVWRHEAARSEPRAVTAPDFGQQYSTRGALIRSTTSAATPPAEGRDALVAEAVRCWLANDEKGLNGAMTDLAALAPEQPDAVTPRHYPSEGSDE